MRNTNFFLILISALLLVSCKTTPKREIIEIEEIDKQLSNREYSKQAVLWTQLSAEYRALSYQAFNLAKFRIDEAILKNANSKKPLAIITDLDETIIDNSAYNAHLIQEDKNYTSETWAEWVKMEKTGITPGALDFINYAKSKNVDLFYISNRNVDRQEQTLRNLKALGITVKDEKHILLKEKSSAKETRRQKVYDTHNVVLYMGDNLSDFAEIFDKKSTEVRNSLVDKIQADFGSKFIVFPNPMYGDWETKGLFEGKYDWTVEQRDSIMSGKLRGY